jgi:hypothetical protein
MLQPSINKMSSDGMQACCDLGTHIEVLNEL